MMIQFPRLIILDETTTKDGIKLYEVELYWNEFEKIMIENHINHIISYYIKSQRSSGNPHGDKIKELYKDVPHLVEEALKKLNWKEYFRPTQSDEVDLITKRFLIREDYWKEMMRLKKLVIDEQKRLKPQFDTNVREKVFEVPVKSIEIFFYLISDALQMHNGVPYRRTQEILCLNLYRFWREQTGIGLIIKKSFNHLDDYQNDEGFKKLKQELEKDISKHWLPSYTLPAIGSTSGDSYYYHLYLIEEFLKSCFRERKILTILED
jgi:hypothetical protein